MYEKFGQFIDGKWQASSDNQTYDVINPATGKNFTVEECAANTVPNGKKYKIVPDSDIPTDMSFRSAWTVDETDLTDGTGTFTGVLAQ